MDEDQKLQKMNKITLRDIKDAMKDPKFRDSLPKDLQDDVVKYLQNPGCTCNTKFYRTLLKDYKQYVIAYFPGREVTNEPEEISKLAENHWTVINCSIFELEDRLKQLPKGRKQLAISRYQDQLTVVVNELDIIY